MSLKRFDSELTLNKVAQKVETLEWGMNWFGSLSSGEQLESLRYLVAMISQAHPKPDEVTLAIQTSELKPTYTPVVLLGPEGETLSMRLAKILRLPQSEYLKSFRLLIRLLAIADSRRKETECQKGCSHWWHQDLSSAADE